MLSIFIFAFPIRWTFSSEKSKISSASPLNALLELFDFIIDGKPLIEKRLLSLLYVAVLAVIDRILELIWTLFENAFL